MQEERVGEMGIDVGTVILAVILIIVFLGRCVVDWIELRDWWWEMIAESDEEENGD